jgi:hypothetical protein
MGVAAVEGAQLTSIAAARSTQMQNAILFFILVSFRCMDHANLFRNYCGREK